MSAARVSRGGDNVPTVLPLILAASVHLRPRRYSHEQNGSQRDNEPQHGILPFTNDARTAVKNSNIYEYTP
jgi:hypothetical protein